MMLKSLFKHWSYRLFAPGVLLREKYEAFKGLLACDSRCHELMADLQELGHSGQREDLCRIRKRCALFSAQVAGIIDNLEIMAPVSFATLRDYHKKFDFSIRFALAPPETDFGPPFVLPLADAVNRELVGNKAKNLAMLVTGLGAPVPQAFVVTANAYHYFIEYNNLRPVIDDLLAEVNIASPHSLHWIAACLQESILAAEVPPAIAQELRATFTAMEALTERPLRIAVRSSAVGEDGECSFAGQYSTLTGISRETLIDGYRRVLASKYSPEALVYRIHHGLCDEAAAMAVLLMEMVPALCSGVLYTRDPLNEIPDGQLLHVVAGFGAGLVGGAVVPERIVLAGKSATTSPGNYQSPLSPEQRQILGEWGTAMDSFFAGPQDIEWAMDADGALYFLQCRPLRIVASGEPLPQATDAIPTPPSLLATCEKAAGGVAAGTVYRLDSDHLLEDLPSGSVLLTNDTPPALGQYIDRLAAVVAEKGSRASHFATVAREFGVPLLTGAGQAVAQLTPGSLITVDGDRGAVYAGRQDALLRSTAPSGKTRYERTLEAVLRWITPLGLLDPAAENFRPEGCRSMHDIIRFCHEKAMHAMFSGGRPGSGRGSRQLESGVPLAVYLFDVGGGLAAEAPPQGKITLASVLSVPFHALWQGLSHPAVQWKKQAFDWNAHSQALLGDGLPPAADSFALASYAVLGSDYLHCNIRFGYHFTVVDSLCGGSAQENYCFLRFAGGGADFSHRSLRIDFLTQVLERLAFSVEQKGDLLEARIANMSEEELCAKLDMLGRLLGAAKLMDMVLVDEASVHYCVEAFLAGRYSFSAEG